MIPHTLYLAGMSRDVLNVDLLYRIETMVEGNKPEEGYVAAMALLDYPLPPSFLARRLLQVVMFTAIQAPLFPKMLWWKISHKAGCGKLTHMCSCFAQALL